jgi:hypothetical protein
LSRALARAPVPGVARLASAAFLLIAFLLILPFVFIFALLLGELLDVGVLALLVVAGIVLLDEFAVLDHTPPSPGFLLSRLDESLESV